jgi:hypothetical protein
MDFVQNLMEKPLQSVALETVIGGGSDQTLWKHLQSCLVQDSVYFHAGLGRAWDYPEQLKAS